MRPSQKTSLRRLPLLLAALFALALLPAAAMAGGGKAEFPLPQPKTTKIEIPGSLGGVELGQTKTQALAEWGTKGICRKDYCHWGPNRYADKGEANISFEGGLVANVSIRWSPQFTDGNRPIRRSITKFHTPEGIRLKSTAKEVKKAYPQTEPIFLSNDIAYKFETPDATMYIHVGRLVKEFEVRPPGFEYSSE